MKASITLFSGEVPRVSPEKLTERYAASASVCNVDSGALAGAYADLPVQELSALPATIYRYDDAGTKRWLWSENDLDIVKGPIADDTKNRVFFTGLGGLRVMDADSVTGDEITEAQSFVAGVPAPTMAPSFSVTTAGASSETEDITYVYTLVREWGDGKIDEGPPSPAAEVANVKIDDVVTVTGLDGLATPSGVSKRYIYRSQTDSEGIAALRWVGEVDLATTTFVDDLGDNTPGETLASTEYFPPEDGVEGAIVLTNGSLVVFKGTKVYFSEPFQPHAFPPGNSQTLDYDIVGLGSFGNYVVACTKGTPTILYADDPAAVQVTSIASPYPCLSKRGIVADSIAVYYPSSDGLVQVSTSGAQVMSTGIISREKWQKLGPENMKIVLDNKKLIFSYYKTFAANTLATTEVTKNGAFILSIESDNEYVMQQDFYTPCFYHDKETGEVYYIMERNIGSDSLYFITLLGGNIWTRKPYTWKSKLFVSEEGPVNIGCGRIILDSEDDGSESFAAAFAAQYDASSDMPYTFPLDGFDICTTALAADLATALAEDYEQAGGLVLKVFADGKLRAAKRVTSDKMFKLPAGFRATKWQFELSGTATVYRAEFATSSQEF